MLITKYGRNRIHKEIAKYEEDLDKVQQYRSMDAFSVTYKCQYVKNVELGFCITNIILKESH